MAWNLLELRSGRAKPKGGSWHDQDQTEAATEAEDQTVGNDLGDPRCFVGADPPDPLGVLAQEADRSADRRLARRPQWDHLPDAHRLPVGATPPPVRPQEPRPRLVPAPVRGRRHGADLGRPRRGLRRVGRGRMAVAERRGDAGQGPVRGGKRRARIPRIVARWAPGSRRWSRATAARWGW